MFPLFSVEGNRSWSWHLIVDLKTVRRWDIKIMIDCLLWRGISRTFRPRVFLIDRNQNSLLFTFSSERPDTFFDKKMRTSECFFSHDRLSPFIQSRNAKRIFGVIRDIDTLSLRLPRHFYRRCRHFPLVTTSYCANNNGFYTSPLTYVRPAFYRGLFVMGAFSLCIAVCFPFPFEECATWNFRENWNHLRRVPHRANAWKVYVFFIPLNLCLFSWNKLT